MSFEERYARQVALPEIGPDGQKKIGNGSVLCVGVGGLGSAAALYLAGAGVGRIGMLDPDVVSIGDLHRQIIHTMEDLDTPKVVSAQKAVLRRNPEVRVDAYHEALTPDNACELLSMFDVVLDCSDNFRARFLVNDACYFTHRPVVSGSVFQSGGQLTTFLRIDSGPCYRCLYAEGAPPDVVPPAAEAGVLGIAAGVIGILQASEALKIIADVGELLHGRLLLFDALSTSFRTVHVRKNVACVLCGTQPSILSLSDLDDVRPPEAEASVE